MTRLAIVAILLLVLGLMMSATTSSAQQAAAGNAQTPAAGRIGFVIHGGAGTLPRNGVTPEREAQFRKELETALMTGYKILQDGGKSLDAVEKTINFMEDSPLFNAGK